MRGLERRKSAVRCAKAQVFRGEPSSLPVPNGGCVTSAIALLLLSMGAGRPAWAQPFSEKAFQPRREERMWVNMGGTSRHFQNAHRFNEQNAGYGLEYAIDRERYLVIGAYLNSVRRTTRYLGGAWTPLTLGPFKFGVLAGVADGYPKMRGGGFFPLVLPLASMETRYVGVNFTVMPSVAGKVSGCIGMQLKFRFR